VEEKAREECKGVGVIVSDRKADVRPGTVC
jgi:hypothetical protein